MARGVSWTYGGRSGCGIAWDLGTRGTGGGAREHLSNGTQQAMPGDAKRWKGGLRGGGVDVVHVWMEVRKSTLGVFRGAKRSRDEVPPRLSLLWSAATP